MTETARGLPRRPLSPHLQVWRWHITMLTSILHRATGVALYVGALLVTVWTLALATGPDVYHQLMAALATPIGRFVMVGLTFSLMYHLASGLRHLVWDTGSSLDKHTATLSSGAVIAFGFVGTLAVWGLAYVLGAL